MMVLNQDQSRFQDDHARNMSLIEFSENRNYKMSFVMQMTIDHILNQGTSLNLLVIKICHHQYQQNNLPVSFQL